MTLFEPDLFMMAPSPQGSLMSFDFDDLTHSGERDDLRESACPLDGLDGSVQGSAQSGNKVPT